MTLATLRGDIVEPPMSARYNRRWRQATWRRYTDRDPKRRCSTTSPPAPGGTSTCCDTGATALPASARWRPDVATSARFRLDVQDDESQFRARMIADIRDGLTAHPRRLPPKYFYDEAGSGLFERITELPEYYLTRAEGSILRAI